MADRRGGADRLRSRVGGTALTAAICASALVGVAQPALAAPPPVSVAALLPQQVSTDPYSGGGAQHATEVEPQIAAHGSDVVGVFQVGRYNSGGSAENMGWVTSHDGGASWVSGFLPGVTTVAGGSWPRTVNQSAFYDEAHGVWLIAALGVGLIGSTYTEQQAFVSRSTDGEHWSAPASVTASGQPDKAWFVCDNGAASPYRGTCYGLWQKGTALDAFQLTRSTDGGLTWSAPIATPAAAKGYNVQPEVQPNGTLVVVATDNVEGAIVALRSTDGGHSLGNPVTVAPIVKRTVSQIRAFNKPSAGVAADGRVYAVWPDCRFRAGCSTDDVVMSSSADGVSWSAVARLPIDPVSSTVDHLIPGLGVDPATSGASTRLSVIYHYLPVAACGAAGQPACVLNVAMVTSEDAGASWSAPTVLNQTPQQMAWLPVSFRGHMVGDVFNVVYVGGNAVTLFPIAAANTATTLNQSMHAVVIGPKTVAAAGPTVTQPTSGASTLATFTVQLSAPQPVDVSVDYTTVDGTARAATGIYQSAAGTVTIPAGAQTAAVDVLVTDDGTRTSARSFSLRLSNPVGVSIARKSATATITLTGPPPPPPPPPPPDPVPPVPDPVPPAPDPVPAPVPAPVQPPAALLPTVPVAPQPGSPVPSAIPVASKPEQISTRLLLADLRVGAEHSAGFSPSRFGSWVDADHDACNTRNEVLFSAAKPHPRVLAGCRFAGGRWVSAYDGRRVASATAIDVTQQVPISEAWQSGGWKWDIPTRKAYLNDLGYRLSLVPVTSAALRLRADREPQQWTPQAAYRCGYLASWVAVKWRWHLGVDAAERAYLEKALAGCGWPKVDKPLRPVSG